MTQHSVDQIKNRLTPEEGGVLESRIQEVESRRNMRSMAVRLMVLRGQRNPAWGQESNGDTVVGVFRDGRLITVMLRRSTQPFDKTAFDVEVVYSSTVRVKEGQHA